MKNIAELSWLAEKSVQALQNGMGSKGRHLMVTALSGVLTDGDVQAVSDILAYCIDHRILLHITSTIMSVCNKRADY